MARFGDSDRARIGDTVLAMGSPMAVSQSVTKGIVSNLQLMMPSLYWFAEFKLDGESVGSLVRWIGHDAVIFGGNSGGPLVNLDGEIIGINEVGLGSLGGAIPANLARSVAEQIIKKGFVERSWTGLEPQPLLARLGPGPRRVGGGRDRRFAGGGSGPPRRATSSREFDGAAVNGRIPEDLPVFNALVMSTPIGKQVEVKALRDGREQTFTLATRARGKAKDKDLEFKSWGFTARNFTLLSAIERKRADTNGVLVTTIDPAGPAGSAKPPLQADDCIVSVAGKPVRSVADLREITAQITRDANRTELVVVEFERGVSRMLTAVRPKPIEREPEENARKPGLSMLLQPIGPELAEAIQLKQDGARVSFVFPGGAAQKAGIRVGDILTRFDGETVPMPPGERPEPLPGHRPPPPDRRRSRVRAAARQPAAQTDFETRSRRSRRGGPEELQGQGTGIRSARHDGQGTRGSPHPRRREGAARVGSEKFRLGLAGARGRGRSAALHRRRPHARRGRRRAIAQGGRREETAQPGLPAAAGVHTLFAEVEPTWDSPPAGKP